MKKMLLQLLLISLLLTGCINQGESHVVKPVTVDGKDPIFEFKGFSYSHEKTVDDGFYTERYTGRGYIEVKQDVGPEENYLVLVNVRRISGGSGSITNDTGPQNIIVRNGIGVITTFDSEYREEKAKDFTQPVYEVDIIGYIKYNNINNQAP